MANVLIHSLVFAPDGVSTAYLYSDLARELRNLGHKITVLTTTPHFNVLDMALKEQPLSKKRGNWLYYSEYHGIPVWHIAMRHKPDDVGGRLVDFMKFHFRALQFGIFSHEKYDVILSPSPPLTMGLVSWLLAKKFCSQSVYNVQEIYPDYAINQEMITNTVVIWLLRLLERFVYSRSEIVVTIGERFKEIVASRGGPALKVKTIPNFVDTELYRPIPRDNAFAREHGLIEKFVVLYAGNVGPAQDWNHFLSVAQRLSNLEIKFLIVGDGSLKQWLEKEAKRLGLENVCFLGYQQRDMMSEINGSCDITTILMNPKIATEGFPSKIYTTMACGKPTVVSCPVNSELVPIVEQSQCGVWVNDNDDEGYLNAIKAYMYDNERLRQEGEKGREFVLKGFSKEAVGKKYDQLISGISVNEKN